MKIKFVLGPYGYEVVLGNISEEIYNKYSQDNLIFGLMLKDVEEQNDLGIAETNTAGYQMLNARLTRNFDLGNQRDLTVSIFGNNLLDEIARNHSSYVKTQVPLPGRNYGIRFNLTF